MSWVAPSLSLKKRLVVGVADMSVSNDPSAVLITHSLGSCLGITIYDGTAHVGGLLHLMLPNSKIDPNKAAASPYMFVDTGVPLLFRTAYQMGADKARLIIKVAGGAEVMGGKDFFSIGKRNYAALVEIFARNGVSALGESVGGQVSRTVSMDVGTGVVTVRIPGEPDFQL